MVQSFKLQNRKVNNICTCNEPDESIMNVILNAITRQKTLITNRCKVKNVSSLDLLFTSEQEVCNVYVILFDSLTGDITHFPALFSKIL